MQLEGRAASSHPVGHPGLWGVRSNNSQNAARTHRLRRRRAARQALVTDPFRSSRAATLMQSDPGRVSVGALVPRGGLHQSCEINDLGKSRSIDPSTPGKVSHQRADSAARSATRNYPKADFGRMLHSPSEGRCRCLRGKAAKKRTYFQRLCADRVTTRKNPRERCASSAGTRSSIG